MQKHQQNGFNTAVSQEASKNPDELVIDDDDEEEEEAAEEADGDTHLVDPEALIHPEVAPLGTADSTADPTAPDESVDLKTVTTSNPDEINMDDEDEDEEPKGAACTGQTQPQAEKAAVPVQQHPEHALPTTVPALANTEAGATRFLALSKCLPGQDFLQVCFRTPWHNRDC